MNAIWFNGFPLAPSVNETLRPRAMSKISRKTGKQFWGGVMTTTAKAKDFKVQCQIWRLQNKMAVERAAQVCQSWIDAGGQLKVDVFAVFHVERVFTVNKKILQLDADNRGKPTKDGVARILGIDDKHFFSGDCEKVTTATKDLECAIIRISPMKARTREQIVAMMRTETQSG
jgi:hypothetical protein